MTWYSKKTTPNKVCVYKSTKCVLYTPQKREEQQSQGEKPPKIRDFAPFPTSNCRQSLSLGENWGRKMRLLSFGMRWGQRWWLGEGIWGHKWDKHIQQNPSPSIHPPPEWHPRKSREAAQGLQQALGKAGSGFGSGYGCMDWEFGLGIKLVCHQILQFCHCKSISIPNPFIHHYPIPWIQFSSWLGFFGATKTWFYWAILYLKSHGFFLIFF